MMLVYVYNLKALTVLYHIFIVCFLVELRHTVLSVCFACI